MAIDPNNLAGTATLTFEDNFNTLNLWNGTTGWKTIFPFSPPEGASLPSNDEKEFYINHERVATDHINPWSVSGGILSLTAAAANPADYSLLVLGGTQYYYTSGMLSSYNMFSQKYGYFECRCKPPAGRGLWSAFWLIGGPPYDWPPEIDIFEFYGSDTTHYDSVVHSDEITGQHHVTGSIHYADGNLTSDFHRYGLLWDQNNLKFYFDGTLIYTTYTPNDMHVPMFIVLNLALQNIIDGTTPFPSSLEIDYVRVYTDAGADTTLTPALHVDTDTIPTHSFQGASTYQQLDPPYFENTNTHYAHSIAGPGGIQTLSPSLYADTDSFFSGTVINAPFPDIVVAVVEILPGTSTGTLDITTSDLGGRTPKAAIVVGSRHPIANDPNSTVQGTGSIGFAAGSVQNYAMALSLDAQASTDVVRQQNTDALYRMQIPSGLEGYFTFSSFITNGIRINRNDAMPFAVRCYAILFAGDDISAKTGTINLGTGTSPITVSGLGFEPDVVFTAGSHQADGAAQAFFGLMFGIGVNDGSNTQKCVSWAGGDGVAAGDPSQIIRSNRIAAQQNVGGATEAYNVTIGNYQNGSFDVTPSVSAGGDYVHYLALDLGGAGFSLFDINTPTSTGDQTYNTPGFRSQALVYVGTGLEARDTSVYNDNKAGGFAIGAVTANERMVWRSRFAQADPTSSANVVADDTTWYPFANPVGTSLSTCQGAFVAFTSSGITVNWTTVHTAARMGFALAIEERLLLQPPLVASDDSFFSPTINQTIGGQSLLSPVIEADDAFFQQNITQAFILIPPLFAPGDGFFTQVIVGAQQLSPSLYADTDAFFTPNLGTPAATLYPFLYQEQDFFYSPSLGNYLVNILAQKQRLVHIVELDIFQRLSTSDIVQWIWPFGFYAFSTLPEEDLPASGVQTLRYSDTGYKTPNAGTYLNTWFPGQVEQPLRLTRSIPVVPEMGRRVNLEIGAIEIINQEGEFDQLPVQYAIDGRRVQVLIGVDGYTYDEFFPIFMGRAVSWTAMVDNLLVEVRDESYQLDKPLQLTLYAGTGGAEGTTQNEGKPKPKCFGNVHNLSPVMIDPANLVFQFHDRDAQAVDEVYDQGARITPEGDDYASYTALVGATIASGKFATCLAEGMFRLGSSPSGLITCDVRGDADATYTDNAGAIAKRIMKDFGSLSDSDFDSGSWDNFTNDITGPIGIYFPDPILISEAVSQIMSGCAAWWGASISGLFQAQRLQPPDGANVSKAFYEYDVLDMERVHPPQGAFPPRHRQRVGYGKNWTVQRGEDLAGSVSDDRRQFLRDAYRVVSTFDDNVRQEYFLSTTPTMLESLFTGEGNLVLYSQDFSQGAWTKSATTLGSTSLTAPDGTSTATKLDETATTASHTLSQSFSGLADDTYYALFAHVKQDERNWVSLLWTDKSGTVGYQYYNVNTGALGTGTGGGPGLPYIDDLGNGWYRIGFYVNTQSGTVTPSATLYMSTADNQGAAPSYLGNAGSGVEVWGFQLELGKVASHYKTTTTAAVLPAKDHAQDLSDDLMTLLKVTRETIRITVDLDGHLATIGSTVQLTHQRVNQGEVWVARVIDMTINSAERTVDLVLWG